MTATFTGTLNTKINFAGADTLDAATLSASALLNLTTTYTAGTGSGKIDIVTTDVLTSGSAANSYDLDGGTLVNLFGTAKTYVNVKYVFVQNTGTGSLTVGGDFLLASDAITIPAGGSLALDLGAAGINVTAGTGDVITVTTTATSFKIFIAGATA